MKSQGIGTAKARHGRLASARRWPMRELSEKRGQTRDQPHNIAKAKSNIGGLGCRALFLLLGMDEMKVMN